MEKEDGTCITKNDEAADGDVLLIFDSTIDIGVNHKVVVNCQDPFAIEIAKQELLDKHSESLLLQYLPYALLPIHAEKSEKIFVISHFAQTLDGRIASSTGDSRWIGNQENLIHAHRMRALCDAVLVGAKTNKIDKPKLNVRHVNGEDPIKVVVGNGQQTSENHEKLFIDTSDFEVVNDKEKNVSQILRLLHDKDVRSVYLEGGSATSSAFLRQGKIDQVQIHFSSKILGSGKHGYNFNGINEIGDSVQFNNPRFIPVGNEIMFLGEL